MELDPRVLFFLGWAFIATQGRFLSLLFLELGLSEREVGTVFAVPTFLNMIFPIAWGLLADKWLDWRVCLTLSALGGTGFYSLLLLQRFHTFEWILLLRTLQSITLAGVLPLLDAACLKILDQRARKEGFAGDKVTRRALYGWFRMFGTIGWGVTHFTLGLCFDKMPYLFMVPAAVVLSIVFVTYIWLTNAPQVGEYELVPKGIVEMVESKAAIAPSNHGAEGQESWNQETKKLETEDSDDEEDVKDGVEEQVKVIDIAGEMDEDEGNGASLCGFLKRCLQVFNLTFIVTIAILAVGQMQVESLVFIFFRFDMDASNLLLGVSVVVTVAFEIPLFAVGSTLLQRVGPANLMLIGMLCYASRVFVYTLITEDTKWFLLFVEPLHGVTYTTTQLASVFFVSQLASEKYENFAQGFLVALKSIGFGSGVFLGAWAMSTLGSHMLYRIAGSVIFTNAIVFYVVHLLTRNTRV